MTSIAYYAAMADRMERDPINGPDANGRATVPNGRGFALWQRMNPNGGLVWIDDVDGKPVWITPHQANLIGLLQTLGDGTVVRMRDLAATLGVSPSTVSRGMVKLASFGRLTYVTSRGRHGGTIVYRLVGDTFRDLRKRLREEAKAKVRAWAKAAQARLSRLQSNVASIYPWREIEAHKLGSHYLLGMDATLERGWTVAEIKEALGE